MVEVRQRSRHIFQKDNCRFGLSDDPANVGPDRGTIQPSVLSTPNEHVLAERVCLAVGEGAVGRPKGEVEPEVDPPDPRAEREAIHRSAPQKASKSFT